MRAQIAAGSVIEAIDWRCRRSKVLRLCGIVVLAVCLSGCAIPLRESDRSSDSSDSPQRLSGSSIVVGAIGANAREVTQAILRILAVSGF